MIHYLDLLLLSPYLTWQDIAEAWQMGFQDPVMQCYIIKIIVLYLLGIKICYCFDDRNQQPPEITIRGTACSEYWLYQYSGTTKAFQSRPLMPLRQRPLFADKRLVVFEHCLVNFIITSVDILHNWEIPSLGIKCEVVPGYIAKQTIYFPRPGIYYGICSTGGPNEPDKGMPFVIEVLPLYQYAYWMSNPTGPGAEPVPIDDRYFLIPFPRDPICNSAFRERPPTAGSFKGWGFPW